MYVVWTLVNPELIFCIFFRNLNLVIVILSIKVNVECVPCVRNNLYSFMLILLKRYRSY